MSEIECETLRQIFAPYNKKGSIGFELGSLHGRSSVEISQAIPLGTLYCVDPWASFDSSNADLIGTKPWIPKKGTLTTLEFFLANTRNCKNIVPKKGRSPQDIKGWTTPVDFVFLDCKHTNPSDWDNIEFWMPKIKKGGLLSGHDFYPDRREWPDVHDNVRRLEKMLNQTVSNPKNTSIWYFTL